MSKDNLFSSGEMQLVTFSLGREIFGIDIMSVQEIIRTPSITMVPQAPAYVEGITNLRGNILPVIDTRTKFGLERTERDIASRVIVVEVGGQTVGLSVDAVSEVLRVENASIEPAPAMVAGVDASSIAGVVKINEGQKLVMILEASGLCSIEGQGKAQDVNWKAGRESKAQLEEKRLEEAQLVTFQVGNEEFALEIKEVREIIRYPEIVRVPNVPDYIKGVISLRDALLPIIDMRVKLEVGSEITSHTRVMVVDVGDTRIGLIVDKVNEVACIQKDTIFPPPQAIIGEGRERLKGIARLEEGKRIIMLLDLSDIISGEELKELGQNDQQLTEAAEEEKGLLEGLDEEQMVVFRLDGEEYGVRITQVQEINRISKITKVPRAPRFVEGVVNLRGDVIPVIDLRKRFDINSKEYNEFTRIIVSDLNHKKIGIIVDEVLEVLRVSKGLLEEVPEMLQDNQVYRFMDGIANLENRMIIMLNLENILVEKEWQKLKEMNKPKNPPAKKSGLKKQGRKE